MKPNKFGMEKKFDIFSFDSYEAYYSAVKMGIFMFFKKESFFWDTLYN